MSAQPHDTVEDEPDPQEARSGLRSPRILGAIVIVAAVLGIYLVYHKQQISSIFSFGDTITAAFPQQYKLDPYHNDVKLAGVVVGTITGDDYDPSTGIDTVSMKLQRGTLDKLGTEPSAAIRPTLVLGGKYYVDLVPGGHGGRFTGDQIPLERTRLPVELDRVLSALTPSAIQGIRSSIGQLGSTLDMGGKDALRSLLADAPPTLGPATQVLTGFEGTQPDDDLPAVVRGFDNFAKAFNHTEGESARITDNLKTTTAAFRSEGGALASTAAQAPSTLREARAGLIDLQPTLRKLTVTADAFRPSVRELDPFLKKLDPTLKDARPLLDDLHPLLEDLRPLVHDLVPTSRKLGDALDDLGQRPVLRRINGPIRDAVYSPYHGKAPYINGGDGNVPLYKELGYLLSSLDGTFEYHDVNGGFARLDAGFGGNSMGGAAFPRPSEQELESFGLQNPKGPQEPPPATSPVGPKGPNTLLGTQQQKSEPSLPGYPGNQSKSEHQNDMPFLGGMAGGSR